MFRQIFSNVRTLSCWSESSVFINLRDFQLIMRAPNQEKKIQAGSPLIYVNACDRHDCGFQNIYLVILAAWRLSRDFLPLVLELINLTATSVGIN